MVIETGSQIVLSISQINRHFCHGFVIGGNELVALLEQSLVHTTSLCDNSPNIFIVLLD